MRYDTVNDKISSIKTYALVAWIFSIIVNVVEILATLFFVGSMLYYLFIYRYSYPILGLLVYSIIAVVFLIPSILVMRHSGRLYNAAKRADVQELKYADSVGWGVVALIFTGVIPGIMLLIAHGSISDLQFTKSRSSGSTLEEDSLAKLERLKSLQDEGILSKDEFEEQKKKILKPMTKSSTPEEELRRLKELLDAGAINEAEFKAQKKRILSNL